MSPMRTALWSRLADKGLGHDKIPHFLRCLTNLLVFIPGATLEELNRWLQAMGWNQIDMDDDTLQLVQSTLQAQEFNDPQSFYASLSL